MRRREILRRIHKSLDAQGIPRLHVFLGTDQPVMRDSVTKKVCTSREAADVLRPFYEPFMNHRECMYLLMLNRGNGVIGAIEISVGGIHACIGDAKVIYGAALSAQSSTIILCHNHPSGQCRPSHEDIMLTKELVAAGRTLGICFQDHIILTSESYYSFADNGQLI